MVHGRQGRETDAAILYPVCSLPSAEFLLLTTKH